MDRVFTRLLVLALLLSVSGCTALQRCSDDPQCTRVLFIGNSYTLANDLPGMFADLAKAGGQRVEVDTAAEGRLRLVDHAASTTTLEKIKGSAWDFVVLQEQSQIPAVRQLRNEEMYGPARTLVGLIREAGAEPVFFLTWGHANGWPENSLPTFETMQQGLLDGYLGIAQELDARIAPVGIAWVEAYHERPALSLWQADGSHPAVQGTYLAACVFYATVFGESPEGLGFYSDLTKEEAEWLQKVAGNAVLRNKRQWQIP